jgi:hypothetical protein
MLLRMDPLVQTIKTVETIVRPVIGPPRFVPAAGGTGRSSYGVA